MGKSEVSQVKSSQVIFDLRQVKSIPIARIPEKLQIKSKIDLTCPSLDRRMLLSLVMTRLVPIQLAS